MMQKKLYIIRDAETGELLAKGTVEDCAAQMGILPGSLRSNMTTDAKRDIKKYRIVKAFPSDFFGSPCPCSECCVKGTCSTKGRTCEEWREWFIATWNRMAGKICEICEWRPDL